MDHPTERPFHAWIRELVERICRDRGITRVELAKDLGVNVNTLSTGAFRADVSLRFLEKLAVMAKATPDELVAIDLGWFRTRSQRRIDPSYERVVQIISALLLDVREVEDVAA